MARQRRHTEPLETVHGVLTSYEEIDAHLLDGEVKGRTWVFDRARTAPRLSTPSDTDIVALHRAMFGDLLSWAGEMRKDDRGPGGKVPVIWWNVPVELRKLSDDARAWVEALDVDPDVPTIAEVVADFHHRFQWIHPFRDTNGRTGRVIDTYVLWVTFGLAGSDLASSPVIEPFPTPAHEDEYYEGLAEADVGSRKRLRAYYVDRIVAAFDSMTTRSDPPQGG